MCWLDHCYPTLVDPMEDIVTYPTPYGKNFPPIPLTKTDPWQHQLEAYWFASQRRSAMLAMHMGTGKTKVAIDLLVNRGCQRVLVLCPNSVVDVWPGQFYQHAGVQTKTLPLRHYSSVKAKQAEAQRCYECEMGRLAVVINYESAWREPFAAWALKQPWDALILDESHRIKAPGGKASRFVSRLADRVKGRAGFVLALTGTPMPHSPLDIYAQFRALDKEVFGTSFTRFRGRYAIVTTAPGFPLVTGYQHQDELQQKFYSLAYRVGPEVLDLPEALHETRYCTLSPGGRTIYKNLEDDFYAQVEIGEITAANALVKALRLQQATSGFGMTTEGQQVQVDDAKTRLLQDILEDLDEPVVVFCRFRHDLNVVHQVYQQLYPKDGYGALELSGRRNELAEWQNGDKEVLAVQIQAGGLGIDLTRARVAIYYSMGLSLGDHQQSLARLHRPGQTRAVLYYYLVAKDTIDERVQRALADKEDVIEAILRR